MSKLRRNEDTDQAAKSDEHSLFRILVAEDVDDLRRIMVELLRGAGYQVDEVRDGVEALEAATDNTYDLIVTDNTMPRMTGIDLLTTLQSSNINTPAILVTGQIPTEELSRRPDLQFEAIILKPYTAVGLLAVVENIFSGLDCGESTGAIESSSLPGDIFRHPLKPHH